MRKALLFALTLCLASTLSFSQQDKSKRPSPPATASCKLSDGATITIDYSSPRAKGRTIFGGLVPFGKVWRTGANEATTFVTSADVTVGGSAVPKGSYTLYTIPEKDHWTVIINKQTGQWGTEYDQSKDLGRVELKAHTLAAPQEVMSISFDDVKKDSAELHIRWETRDESVKVTTP